MTDSSASAPNFFLVGAPKAGTTALYDALHTHTDIFVSPIKEPNYFCTDLNSQSIPPQLHDRLPLDIESYLNSDPRPVLQTAWIVNEDFYSRLFEGAQSFVAIGECSTTYLYSRVAARRIREFNPSAKIIAILRDPVDRAWSHFLMDRRIGIANEGFRQTVMQEFEGNARWENSRLYLALGKYGEQLSRYYDNFPSEQILVLRYDRLREYPSEIFMRICAFLGVAPSDEMITRQNVAQEARFRRINRWLHTSGIKKRLRVLFPSVIKRQLRKAWFRHQIEPHPDEEFRQEMRKWFSDDLAIASRLTGLDLSDWSRNSQAARKS